MSQMGDHELDQLGRMAAAHTRAEARAIADSPSALRELLAGESAAPSAEPTVVPVVHTRAVERPRWKLAAVAAAVGVLALGLGWALVNGFSFVVVGFLVLELAWLVAQWLGVRKTMKADREHVLAA